LYQTASAANAATAGTPTRFGYDGVDLIAEYDGAGAVLRRYVHGPGSDEPLMWYEGAGLAFQKAAAARQKIID
jgi:hypothetical protein